MTSTCFLVHVKQRPKQRQDRAEPRSESDDRGQETPRWRRTAPPSRPSHTHTALGKSAARPCCHAASEAILSHSCHGYHIHRHNISIIPRSEKHAPPFWVSFLAAWLKARRGRRRGRRWMLKVCLRHAGGGGRVHRPGLHQRTNITPSHTHTHTMLHSHKNPN